MKFFALPSLLVGLLFCISHAAFAAPAQQRFGLKENLGYGWASTLVHRDLNAPPGQFFPDHLTFLDEGTTPGSGKAVPFQLRAAQLHPDGSVKSAEVWFRTALPANGQRSFLVRATPKAQTPPVADLKIETSDAALEISNDKTAVRLPPVGKSVPEAVDGVLPGPIGGVRLVSGQWTAASQITLPADAKLTERETTILERGPVAAHARVEYRFSNGGQYVCDVEVRQGDNFVRVDERYQKAGSVSFDFGSGLEPTKFATKKDFYGAMQLTPLDYASPKQVISLTGWDIYLPNRTSVLGLLGGPRDDLLAWISSDADWLPNPYPQNFALQSATGGKLTAQGSLADGHRHWGLLAAKGADFPNPGEDLYRWHTKNIFVPLAKVVNWQLTWTGMDDIPFPHTFFDKAELPTIRARLHAEPVVREFMEKLREDTHWGDLPSVFARSATQQQDAAKAYRAKYEPLKGTFRGMTYVTALYLYFGDEVYLDQLNDQSGLEWERTPENYLDTFVKDYLDGTGQNGNIEMNSMRVSDKMLQTYIGLELLMGSDKLSPAQKHQMLIKLAFMTYVMHQAEWQPPVHMPDGSQPAGYGQGTPNQKHGAWSARAMNDCMLGNHPMKKEWMKFTMAELRPHYEYTINKSGALLESPFYSSRDTMRYAPFWTAMTRAGVAEVAPDYKKWMNRPKKAFVYLSDMLTPREPRMGNRRVYQPIGRSGSGVIDPTFMIAGDPWGQDDPQYARRMRWAWEQQGKPSPDIMGTTGGRDLSFTLIAFSRGAEKPLEENPLHSVRYEGMGAILRSHPASDYESNVLWRHDPFSWDLYAVNNGAVYLYGKGAPLLPRFGGYWSHGHGGDWLMDLPFGNRLEFEKGDNAAAGHTTEFSSLGDVADVVGGVSGDGQWKRRVVFAKDLDKDDAVYLLVRDDVSRPDSASSLNWWFMTKAVQPDGLDKPGVVSIKTSHEEWMKNMGHNWKDAPQLTGQTHRLTGLLGVDVDLFIAAPHDPQILSDAASTGQMPYNVAGREMFETQQLVRISQPAGKSYLSLIVPRWPGSTPPQYRTIADDAGVAVTQPFGEDRLFLADKPIAFKDEVADFAGRAGFVRHGADKSLRLMANEGRISADGFTLETPKTAALLYRDGAIRVVYSGDAGAVKVTVPDALKNLPVKMVAASEAQ